MDHRAFVQSLPAEDRAALTAPSDLAGLRHLAGHLGLIAGLGGLIVVGVPGWWLLLPLQGIALIFLFTLEHEATHKTPFRSPWLNAVAGHACGFVLFLPFEWFRYFHLAHHRWTNLPGKDPELDGPKPQTRAQWVWHVSGLPYWGAQARLLAQLVRGQATADYLPQAARPRIIAEARLMVLGYLAVIAFSLTTPVLVWVWLLPVVLGQPVLRLYLLAEHGDCPQVANMFLNTRTTLTTRMVRFLAWNMPFHAEHHVLPQVPFYRLPDLHALMRQNLHQTAPGYLAFTRDYLARRRAPPA